MNVDRFQPTQGDKRTKQPEPVPRTYLCRMGGGQCGKLRLGNARLIQLKRGLLLCHVVFVSPHGGDGIMRRSRCVNVVRIEHDAVDLVLERVEDGGDSIDTGVHVIIVGAAEPHEAREGN
jgi:hypothetical protein